MLLKLLVSILRSWERDTKDVVSFIHAALGPLLLVIFDVGLTGLSEPLLERHLEQRPTIFLYILKVLLLVHVLIPHRIIDSSLGCLVQLLRLLEELLLNEGVIVKLPPTHLLRLLLRPQLLEVLTHQLFYQLLVNTGLLCWGRTLFFGNLRLRDTGGVRREHTLTL